MTNKTPAGASGARYAFYYKIDDPINRLGGDTVEYNGACYCKYLFANAENEALCCCQYRTQFSENDAFVKHIRFIHMRHWGELNKHLIIIEMIKERQ